MQTSEAIKEYMDSNGIKQTFIAKKIGTSPQVLGQLVNGKRKIEVKEFFTICEAMGADPKELAIKAGIYEQKETTI